MCHLSGAYPSPIGLGAYVFFRRKPSGMFAHRLSSHPLIEHLPHRLGLAASAEFELSLPQVSIELRCSRDRQFPISFFHFWRFQKTTHWASCPGAENTPFVQQSLPDLNR